MGLEFIIVVGENDFGGPATEADAAAYKQKNGFPDGIAVVADPGWQKVIGAIQHPGNIGLPYMNLLGGDMEILKLDAAPTDFLIPLAGESGLGMCNTGCTGQVEAGCYCDAACKQYGDCCPDYDEYCGG